MIEEPETFATPEEAAMADMDSRFAQVVVARYVREDLVEVELMTNTPEAPYPYFVQVYRVEGRWCEGSSGNAPSYPEAQPRTTD